MRASRETDRADNAEVADYVKNKVATNSELTKQALILEWGFGMSFFERWQERGVRTVGAVHEELRKLSDNQSKLDWLREQIEMRTRGLQVCLAVKTAMLLEDAVQDNIRVAVVSR